MTETTGMLMSGKISVGVRAIVSAPRMPMRSASTVKVYGRRRARRTIHMLARALQPAIRARRRRHELGPDGIAHVLADDRVDHLERIGVERPAHRLVERHQLLRRARAPQRDLHSGLIEHPAYGEGEHVLAVVLAREV